MAYVIQRELDLLNPPDLNYIALTQDGVFGKHFFNFPIKVFRISPVSLIKSRSWKRHSC